MIRFGFSCLPAVSSSECAELAKECEKSGYDAFWVADEIWYRDPWQVMTVCSAATEKIRIATGVTHMYLRNPAFLAQSLATIDEISSGRAVCGISIGNKVMLDQCNVEVKRPMTALVEAVKIIRTLLAGEVLNFDGEFFHYEGVSLKVKTVQRKLPIFVGAKSGPRSFQVAGELGDGAILTDVYSPEWAKAAIGGIKEGFATAKRTGKEVENYEVASWTLVGIHPDEKVARNIARPIVAFYLPTHFKRQLEVSGVDPSLQAEISSEIAAGRYGNAIRKTTDDVVAKLSITGTPAQVAEKLSRVSKEGIDHFVIAPADNLTLMNLGLGDYRVTNALDATEALRLIEKDVMPRVN